MVDEDLRERDAGEWSGLTRPEIEERFPGYLADHRRPPGWESDEDLLARALRALRRIGAEVPGGDVLAVTHGGLIYTVEGHLGEPMVRIGQRRGSLRGRSTATRSPSASACSWRCPPTPTVPNQI